MPCWNIYILLFSLNLTPNLWKFMNFQHSAANQHIRMISEGSCDTEDWRSDLITGKNDIFKYITTENDWNGYLKRL